MKDMRIVIDLDTSEYHALKHKQSSRTYRELLLGAVDIDATPRQVGRPSLDDVEKNLQKMYEKRREADAEAVRQRLIESNEASADGRKKLAEMYKKNMAKIRGE